MHTLKNMYYAFYYFLFTAYMWLMYMSNELPDDFPFWDLLNYNLKINVNPDDSITFTRWS